MQTTSAGTGLEYDDPFVRWRIEPAAVDRVHRNGDAALIELRLDRHGNPVTGPTLLCLGPPEDLGPLLRDAAQRLGGVPHQVSIEDEAAPLLPTGWRWRERRVWDWMWTADAPPPVPGEDRVVELSGAAMSEAHAVLDSANPHSHGRPGGEGAQRWLGVRDADGRLVATGGMFVLPTGVSHLRGITTLPAARGRGIGTALSARLTRIGLDDGGGVCTLGAYTDNTTAVEIYRRLGFRHAHTFSSGTLLR